MSTIEGAPRQETAEIESAQTRPRRWWPLDLLGTLDLTVFVGLTLVFIISVFYHPYDEGGYVVCMMRAATGVPCPGCGLTRSFCAMGKGDVTRAFHFHWLGPSLFAIAGVYWLRSATVLAGWRAMAERLDAFVVRWKLPVVLLTVLLALWVVKLVQLAIEGRLTKFGW